MKRGAIILVALALVLLVVSIAGALNIFARERSAPEPTTVTMVMPPSGDVPEIAQAAERLAALLEEETGYEVYAFVSGCDGAAVEAMVSGEADVGWLSAVAYVLAHDRFGIEVKLVVERFESTSYRSQFLVHNDSGIDELGDLADKNFAFVDPLSDSGYLYPAVHTSNTQGVTYAVFFSETVFAGSHSAVVEAVYNGLHEGTPIHGGATYEDARWRVIDEYPDVFTETKVIDYTGYIPFDTVSVRPGLDATVAQAVINGLLTIADTPEGAEVLQALYGIHDLQPTQDSAYDIVRQVVAAFGLEYESCSQAASVTSDLGGSLTYTDANGLATTVQMPPGAVTETTKITYAPIPAITYRPPSLIEIGHSFDLTAVISDTGIPLTEFSQPYTITVNYAEGELDSVVESSLALYWWDGDQWTKEPTSAVDEENNKVTASPDHMSRFAVLGTERVYLPLILKNY